MEKRKKTQKTNRRKMVTVKPMNFMNRIIFRQLSYIIILLVMGILLISPITLATKHNQPFYPGETLTYGIKWGIIPVGEGILSVHPWGEINGKDVYHFELKVTSSPFLDSFYKVRNKISSYVATDLTRSYYYMKNQIEGRTKREIIVEFDWDTNHAGYSNFGKQKPPVSIFPGTLDPLSALYFARLQNFDQIEEISVPVTDGRKCIIGKANIVKRENITIESGVFDTYLIEPDIEEIGGIFEKAKNSKIQIWLTADDRRIPVRVESKVPIGSFTAELISIVTEK
jgi:hypothetical protein